MSYLIKTDYGDLKFIVHSSGLETNFSELKNLCFFFFFFFIFLKKFKYQYKKILVN